jgi:hypothetical protein
MREEIPKGDAEVATSLPFIIGMGIVMALLDLIGKSP